jgi:hypothetical protein
MILAISLAYPSRLGAGLLLAHGDYYTIHMYLPSQLLEKVEVEDITLWVFTVTRPNSLSCMDAFFLLVSAYHFLEYF